MNLSRRLRPALLVLALLLTAALACNTPGLFSPTPIAVSTEAAGQLVETLTSITPGPGGEVSVTITQEQLTSYVATELAKTPDVPITQPQIALDNGKITLTGTLDLEGLQADTKIVMVPTVGADGKPDVKIESATFGPLPVPQDILTQASSVVGDALAEEINNEAGVKVNLTSLTIDNGSMTAEGTVAQ
jgi:uncharacterized protein YpmS